MRIVLILFTTSLLIAFAIAERKYNVTKPAVNLDKRPRPPVWHKPPEERRKLSIFPRNNMKFVVTPKTIVKNDEEPKEGLPTKRPLMRKFVMQDRNDKGTWSFAPREPLMKPKRFTIALAPPKFSNNKDMDEMKPEESKKVKTVVNNVKTERESNKINRLNKGNLIQMDQMKTEAPLTTKFQRKIGPAFNEDKVLQLKNINETQNTKVLKTHDSKTLQIDKNVEGYKTDRGNSNNTDMYLKENENKIDQDSVNVNQTLAMSKKEDASTVLAQSRSEDLKDIELGIGLNENSSVIIKNKQSSEDNLEQVKNFIELGVLLEKIASETKEIINNPQSNFKVHESENALKNENQQEVSEATPKFNVVTPSNQEVTENYNVEDALALLIQDSPIVTNNETLTTSENVSNETFTESRVDSLILSDIEGLITFIEQEADGIKNYKSGAGEPYVQDQNEIIDKNDDELELDIVDSYKEWLTTNAPMEESGNNLQNISRDDTIKSSGEFNLKHSFDSKEVSLEEQASSTRLKSNENLMDLSFDVDKDAVSNESTTVQSNLKAEDISNESYIDNSSNSTNEEISNEYVSDVANSFTEELSDEASLDKSNNLTVEEISNESSSNMAGEELSNESNYVDKFSNLTEEGSNYLSEDLSNQSPLDVSNDEERSNESSSNMAAEELSNESYVDKSNNLTEELSNKSTGSVTDEDTLYETIDTSVSSVFDDKQSDVLLASSEDASTGEISEDALKNRFRRSNNIIEEENLATTISGLKYTGQETRLNHNLSYKNINA